MYVCARTKWARRRGKEREDCRGEKIVRNVLTSSTYYAIGMAPQEACAWMAARMDGEHPHRMTSHHVDSYLVSSRPFFVVHISQSMASISYIATASPALFAELPKDTVCANPSVSTASDDRNM